MNILFINGTVIDGNGKVLERGYLAVEDEKIVKLGSGFKGSLKGYQRVIDLAGQCLLPGLIDCHVHLTSQGDADPVAQVQVDCEALSALRACVNGEKTLKSGFTTVRDCGAKSDVVIALRSAIDKGLVSGPRIVAGGRALCMTGGHGWWCGREIDGPQEARKGVREVIKAGADFIKFIATGGIMTEGVSVGAAQLDYDELAAGIYEARKAGKKTAAHAHGAEGIKNAVRAGIDSIEHAFLADEESISLMKAAGTTLVPTVSPIHLVVEKGIAAGIPEYVVVKSRQALGAEEESFKAACAAGLKIALGTDAGMPFNHHGENHQELVAMVELGLPPEQAIIAATSRAAELLGLADKVGTLAPGKEADLLVVAANPLEDIRRLKDEESIKLVMKKGELVVDKVNLS
jgi:imidazolonepropionase-like amidohydrolase